jgi:hypothetical protein
MAPGRTFLAGIVEPCIPTLAAKPPSGADWVHEIKHDGYRLIVRRDGDTVRLFHPPRPCYSGAICSTSRTMARRTFASPMQVNALTKSKPSEVARKSLTNEGEGASSDSSAAGQPSGAGAPSKKKRDRHLKDLGDVLQAAGADAIGPLLVFLDLLERQPEGVSEIGLAHIELEPPHTHAAANMLVDRIEGALGHRSTTGLLNLARLRRGAMRPGSAGRRRRGPADRRQCGCRTC